MEPVTVLLTMIGTVVFIVFVALGSIRNYRRITNEWNCLSEEGVHRGLAVLLKRGYDGSFAIITDRRTGRFIQFRKYIVDKGNIGLEMHFPRAPWSEGFYTGVQASLTRLNISFAREPLATDPVVEVIRADFGTNTDVATAFTAAVARDVFAGPVLCLDFRVNDICPLDELVDSLEHPKSFERSIQYLRERFSSRNR